MRLFSLGYDVAHVNTDSRSDGIPNPKGKPPAPRSAPAFVFLKCLPHIRTLPVPTFHFPLCLHAGTSQRGKLARYAFHSARRAATDLFQQAVQQVTVSPLWSVTFPLYIKPTQRQFLNTVSWAVMLAPPLHLSLCVRFGVRHCGCSR